MNRRGVSLLEVLFAMLVGTIGLLGAISLLPVAIEQANKGREADSQMIIGESAIEEFKIRGGYLPDLWVVYDGANFLNFNGQVGAWQYHDGSNYITYDVTAAQWKKPDGSNANYTPLSWLRINGNAGLDYFGRYDRQTINPNELPLANTYILGFRDAFRASNYIWSTNASAAATFSPLSEVVSTTTVGTGYQRSLFENLECFGAGIPSGTASCSATTSQFAVSESHTDLKTIGLFARQELSYADKLFISGSLRADNNSGLLRNVSGLAYYPSVNGSWVVSREKFFPQSFVSQLRLRAGWGQAGQRPGARVTRT